MKTKDFTQDELSFLSSKIERGTILVEKERIDITGLNSEFETLSFDGQQYLNYKKQNLNKDSGAIKKKILETLLTCKDFSIEILNDDYEIYGAELVTYDTFEETDEQYKTRMHFCGREMIRKEKAKQKRDSLKETRKVLFEKTKKKKAGRPKKDRRPNLFNLPPNRRGHHEDIDMLLDYDFFNRNRGV